MFHLFKLFFRVPGPRYPWKKAVLYLVISTLSISGSACASYLFYLYAKHRASKDAIHTIQAIAQTTAQTGTQNAHFETGFFAEILGISVDKPTNLRKFDLKKAQRMLLSTHIIKEANLIKMKPDLLFIHYTARVPFLFLADFLNTAMDEEGFLFPLIPFYSPRNLPKLYLGQVNQTPWGNQIDQEQLQRVHTLVSILGTETIEHIDLAQARSDNMGKREMVVKLRNGTLLRLNPKNYVQQLNHYSVMKASLLKKQGALIIDLRLPDVAYLQ